MPWNQGKELIKILQFLFLLFKSILKSLVTSVGFEDFKTFNTKIESIRIKKFKFHARNLSFPNSKDLHKSILKSNQNAPNQAQTIILIGFWYVIYDFGKERLLAWNFEFNFDFFYSIGFYFWCS